MQSNRLEELPLRGVLMDAVNTVIHLRHSVGEIYAEFCQRFGKPQDGALLESRFRSAFASAPPLCFPDRTSNEWATLERHWWKERVRATLPEGIFSEAETFEAFFSTLYDAFADPALWAVYPQAREFLELMQQRQTPVRIVSNFDSRLHRILSGLSLRPLVESVFCSAEHGVAKPDPALFQKAAWTDAPPAKVLVIGDSERLDLAPARALGFSALRTPWLPSTR